MEIYHFGAFHLDVGRREIRHNAVPLVVEPRPLEVLAELVRHAGELVTKAELMDSVWAGRVVTDSVIARCINKIRVALCDDSQGLILSVHGYGYRFTGDVVRVTGETDAASSAAVPRRLQVGDAPPMRCHWRLLRVLDDGGIVWLAQHAKTAEQRVFKFGFELHQVRALRREIAINRLLLRGLGERRGIARLLDYNLSEPPYFLELEYCPHGNLAEWSAAQGGIDRLPLDLRIELMATAAEIMAAAHALGVLHLDIKPSNLLVWQLTGRVPEFRWTDFGCGRMLQPGRLLELGITHPGSTRTVAGPSTSMRGTLLYLAPELLRGEVPTIKSDIYALGVMLYQVVAGDLRKPIAVGWEQNIDDELLVADIAAAAQDNPALRLSSADELALRLRSLAQRRRDAAMVREREREALLLRQRLERSRARRPWLIAATAALALGVGFGFWNYRQALEARDVAREQASVADSVINFLDRDILAAGSPFSVSTDGSAHLTVREAVDRAADKLSGRFPGQPAVEASIRSAIGQVYAEDGDYAAAQQQVRKAVQLGRTAAGGVDERTLNAEYSLAFALASDQKFGEAHDLLDEANREVARRSLVSIDTQGRRDTINGNYYLALQDYPQAIPFFERALAEALQRDATDVSSIVIRQTSLAWCYAATRRFAAARPLYAAALQAVKRAEPHGGTLTGTVEERYGIGLFLAGHNDEAMSMLQAAFADLEATIGDDGLTAEALTYRGWLELRTGRAGAAVLTLRKAYQDEFASAGALHSWTLRARACLGLAEIANGQTATGLEHLAAAAAAYPHTLRNTAPEAELFHFLLLEAAWSLGQPPADSAEQLRDLSVEHMSQAAPWEDWNARLRTLKARSARANTAAQSARASQVRQA